MVPILERPFLHYQLDLLKLVPEIDEVILSLNYQPRRIEEIFGDGSETGLAIRYVVEPAPLGQVIDPLADKLLTSAALISLVQMDLAQSWMVAVIIGREFAVTTLRSLAYARGVAMPATRLGKIKMVAQVVAILALILAHGQTWPFYWIGQAALWVVVTTALISGADYFRRFNTILSPRVADFRVPDKTRKAG
jgi:CDP-diacylglycerol--glycerol-3-phosphate 3-phosphatidyltransferase